ncbi:MAG TPA: DUF6457 domain-containing protein [Streptosporangiaceae bacterium]
MTDTAQQWLGRYAARLGVEPPDDDTVTKLLDLAALAARASERTAAPITCWLAARAGLSPEQALAAAREVADGPGPDR